MDTRAFQPQVMITIVGGVKMTHKICPICDREITITLVHDCFDYDCPNFSIELELLGLPFDLEPYNLNRSRKVTYFAPERSTGGFIFRRKHVPLFLRL